MVRTSCIGSWQRVPASYLVALVQPCIALGTVGVKLLLPFHVVVADDVNDAMRMRLCASNCPVSCTTRMPCRRVMRAAGRVHLTLLGRFGLEL
jgi:hypothetical protein